MFATPKVIIWDNDGTIMGSKDPNDASSKAKKMLLNVERVMHESGASVEFTRDHKYLIKSVTNEGVKIEMYMTKNGKIATVYPRI